MKNIVLGFDPLSKEKFKKHKYSEIDAFFYTLFSKIGMQYCGDLSEYVNSGKVTFIDNISEQWSIINLDYRILEEVNETEEKISILDFKKMLYFYLIVLKLLQPEKNIVEIKAKLLNKLELPRQTNIIYIKLIKFLGKITELIEEEKLY